MSSKKTRTDLTSKMSSSDSRSSTSLSGNSSSPSPFKEDLGAMFPMTSLKEMKKMAYLHKSRNSSNNSHSKSFLSQSSAQNTPQFFKKPLPTGLNLSLKGLDASLETSVVDSPTHLLRNDWKKAKKSIVIDPLSLANSLNVSNSDNTPKALKIVANTKFKSDITFSDLEQSLSVSSDHEIVKRIFRKKPVANRNISVNSSFFEKTIDPPEREVEIEDITKKGGLENLCNSDENFNLSVNKTVITSEDQFDGAVTTCNDEVESCEEENGSKMIESHATDNPADKINKEQSEIMVALEKPLGSKESEPEEEMIVVKLANDKSASFGLNCDFISTEVSPSINEKKPIKEPKNISNMIDTDSEHPLTANINIETGAKKSVSEEIVKDNLSTLNTSEYTEETGGTQPTTYQDEISSQNEIPSAPILKKQPITSNLTGLNDFAFKCLEKSLDSSHLQDEMIDRLKKSVKQKRKSVRLSNISFFVSNDEGDASSVCKKSLSVTEPCNDSKHIEKPSTDLTSKGDISCENKCSELSQVGVELENDDLTNNKLSESQEAGALDDKDKNTLGQTFIVSQPCTPSLPVCNTTDVTFTVTHPKILINDEIIISCIDEANHCIAEQPLINNSGVTSEIINENCVLDTNNQNENVKTFKKSKKLDDFSCMKDHDKEPLVNTNDIRETDCVDLYSKNLSTNNHEINLKLITSDPDLEEHEPPSNVEKQIPCKKVDEQASSPILDCIISRGSQDKSSFSHGVDKNQSSEKESNMVGNISSTTLELSECEQEINENLVELIGPSAIPSQNDVPCTTSDSLNDSSITDLSRSSLKSVEKSFNPKQSQGLMQLLRKSAKQKKLSINFSDTSLQMSNASIDSSHCGIATEVGSNLNFKKGSKDIICKSTLKTLPESNDKVTENNVSHTVKENSCPNVKTNISVCIQENVDYQPDNNSLISSNNDMIRADDQNQKLPFESRQTKSKSLCSNSSVVSGRQSLVSKTLTETSLKPLEESADDSKLDYPTTLQEKSLSKKKKSVRFSDASLFPIGRKSIISSQENNDTEPYCNDFLISLQNDTNPSDILKKPSINPNLINFNDSTFKNMEKSEDISQNNYKMLQTLSNVVNGKKKSVRLSNASFFVPNDTTSASSSFLPESEKMNGNENYDLDTRKDNTNSNNNIKELEKDGTIDPPTCEKEPNLVLSENKTFDKPVISSQETNESQMDSKYSIISSQNDPNSTVTLKKPSLISNLTTLNDKTFKNMENSMDISQNDKIMNTSRNVVNQKKKSIRISDTSLLEPNDKSVDCPNDKSAKIVTNEEKNVSVLQIQEEDTNKNSSSKESENVNAVELNIEHLKNTTTGKSIVSLKENNETANSNYSIISSQNDMNSTANLKKSSLISNLTTLSDSTFKNMEKSNVSQNDNEIVKKMRNVLGHKKKSLKLSNASLFEPNNTSVDCVPLLKPGKFDKYEKSNEINNESNNLKESEGLSTIDLPSSPKESIIEKSANRNVFNNFDAVSLHSNNLADDVDVHLHSKEVPDTCDVNNEISLTYEHDRNKNNNLEESGKNYEETDLSEKCNADICGENSIANNPEYQTNSNGLISNQDKQEVVSFPIPQKKSAFHSNDDTSYVDNIHSENTSAPVNVISKEQELIKRMVNEKKISEEEPNMVKCASDERSQNVLIQVSSMVNEKEGDNVIPNGDVNGEIRSTSDDNDAEAVKLAADHSASDHGVELNIKEKVGSISGNQLIETDIFKLPQSSRSDIMQNSRSHFSQSTNCLAKGTNEAVISSGKENSLDWSIDMSAIQSETIMQYNLRKRSQSTPLPPKHKMKSNSVKERMSTPKPSMVKQNISPAKRVDKKKPKKSVTFNISTPTERSDKTVSSPIIDTLTDISAIPREGMQVGKNLKPVCSSPYPPSLRKRNQLVKRKMDDSVITPSRSRRAEKMNVSVQVTKDYISSSSSSSSKSQAAEQSSRKQFSPKNVPRNSETVEHNCSNDSNKRGGSGHVSHKSNTINNSNKEYTDTVHKGSILKVTEFADSTAEFRQNKKQKLNQSSNRKSHFTESHLNELSKRENSRHVSLKKNSVNSSKEGVRNIACKGSVVKEISLDDSTTEFHPKKKQKIDRTREEEIPFEITNFKGPRRSVNEKSSRDRALTSITNTVRSNIGHSSNSTLDSSLLEKSVVFPPKKKARIAHSLADDSYDRLSTQRSFSESRAKSKYTSQLDDSIPLGFSVTDDEAHYDEGESTDDESYFKKHPWLLPLLVKKDTTESTITPSTSGWGNETEDPMPPPKTARVRRNIKLAKPASWANQKLYKFLFGFFKPKYGIQYRKKSEEFVLFLHPLVESVILLKDKVDYTPLVIKVKEKTKELGLCSSIWDFKELLDLLPYPFKSKCYYGGSHLYEAALDHMAPF